MAQQAKDLRNDNRLNIYELLMECDALSRAQISRRTGISGPTVMRVVDELLKRDVVSEVETEAGAVGRRPKGIVLRQDRFVLASIVHEGKWLQAGLVDIRGEVIAQDHVRSAHGMDKLLTHQIPSLVRNMLKLRDMDETRLVGLGIGLPAILDPYGNRIVEAPFIGITKSLDISAQIDKLSAQLGVPVRIENDVNASVIGEHTVRKLGGVKDIAYIAMGTGLGGGLMLRGELRRGPNNMAGEIGYMYVGPGEGSLEQRVSAAALGERFNVDLHSGEIAQELGHEMSQYIASVMAPCIVNMSVLLDLHAIVLGGLVPDLLGDGLYDAINERVKGMSSLPVAVERGMARQPGLVGLGVLMKEQFLKRLRLSGLEALDGA